MRIIGKIVPSMTVYFDLPARYFGAILADPPWHFKPYSGDGGEKAAERHYKTMRLEDIKAMPVDNLAAPEGCHLFLWTTGPHLRQAFDVIDAWGFDYSGVAFTWIKLRKAFNPNQLRCLPSADGDFHFGLGHTTRKNAEFCLLARRGNAKRQALDVRELILAPVRQHSRKPEETIKRIERYTTGPYVELFARSERPGWFSWGAEREKYNG